MNRFCEFMRSRKGTILLFAAAAVLLGISSVGGARAALIYSQDYFAQVQMSEIGVALWENDDPVSHRDEYNEDSADSDAWEGGITGDLLGAIPEKEQLKLNYPYEEKLCVQNTGKIPQYVRVTVYKYWVREDANGKDVPDPSLSPKYIDLHLVNKDLWQVDKHSSTDERTVLYYRNRLDPEEKSELFADTLTISGKVADYMKEEVSSDGKVTTYTYDYDGAQFVLEARVDAVQDHNAEDAVYSSWGQVVSVENNKMGKPKKID